MTAPSKSPPLQHTRRRKSQPSPTKETTTSTSTFTTRPLPYTYLHLSLSSPAPLLTPRPPPLTVPSFHSTSTASSPPSNLDILTAHSALQSALSRFLGLHGAAISVDILHVVAETGRFWVRVPREDGDRVVAAVAGWMGNEGQVLRVKGRGDWLGGLVGGGRDAVWG